MHKTIVKPNLYQDSVALMVLSRKLSDLAGVKQVSVMMGTPANKDILRNTGFGSPEVDAAQPGDMIIGIDAEDESRAVEVSQQALELLKQQSTKSSSSQMTTVRSLARARQKLPEANIALVSIPGEHAADQVRELLDNGLSVMVFSDNVSVTDELALKQQAHDKGLLVMGPDCGTASIAGVPLAFVNTVRKGSIGIVGASGTGTQEVMTQVDQLGAGISHAIGVGGRDLSREIGAITTLQALAALDADETTDVVVIVSKPPAPEVRAKVLATAQQLSKPVVALLLGEKPKTTCEGNIWFAYTMAEAAQLAVELAGCARFRPAASQRAIRGLYTGGTLASEAAMLLREQLRLAPDDGNHAHGIMLNEQGHQVIDLGDDEYTQGRPHPMMDPTSRAQRLPDVFDDETVAVILLDVVLGHGSADDPAGAIAPAIKEGILRAKRAGREVAVVASLCATSSDLQGLDAQRQKLQDAGVRILPNNASAVRHGANLVLVSQAAKTSQASASSPAIASLLAAPSVINVGLASFADAIAHDAHPVIQWTWQPIAGGNARLKSLVTQLMNR